MPEARHDVLPPALLGDATWYGTLAAVRELGSRGVPITLASDAALAPARFSRYVTSAVRCPPTKDGEGLLAWLHEFGDRHPGHVLYPTSDDMAWMIARNQAALAAKYRLYSPPLQALASLLDKGRLSEAADAAGLAVPKLWLPEDETEVERIAREAPFPLFVKPRTQLLAMRGFKGGRVDRPEDLLRAWTACRTPEERERRLGPAMRGSGRPAILVCYPASETIFTVDGFVDRSGEMVALGCNKLLQRPRRVGPGVIFEDAPVPAAIASGLQRLLQSVGFFGVYDAEFLADGERMMLIDINPRFYNHMAFEIDRGLPLAWLAYLGALGDEATLAATMRAARQSGATAPSAYVHRLPTTLMLTFQGLAGKMSRQERRRWRAWIAERSGRLTDPASAPGDRLPGLVDLAFDLRAFLRHPRAFLRDLWRDDAATRARRTAGR